MEWKYQVGHRFEGRLDETGAGVDVVVDAQLPEDATKGWVPSYALSIRQKENDVVVGHISLRIGYTDSLVKYGGHVGYSVDEAHRGHHYAARGCRLVKEMFREHGMDVVWITANPDNWPSRRTCEILGCEFIEIVDLEPGNEMYARGERQKCRYRWIIY
jgi:tagatose 1,6-diphosphate aldolase